MGLQNPGAPGANLPAGEDHIMRRLHDIEYAHRELLAVVNKIGDGKLTNAKLANPVVAGIGGNVTSNFALTATATDKTSVSIPIPAGFTTALVHVTCEASAFNTGAGAGTLHIRGAITTPGGGGGVGAEMYNWTANVGELLSVSASYADIFEGLTPGSITVACQVWADSVWTLMASNIAHVAASIVFLR